MIVPFITFVVGGGLGFVVGRSVENKEVKAELVELRRRLEIAQGRSSTPVPALIPSNEYRDPDREAVINLPVDKEDFTQLHEAMCSCVAALRAEKDEGQTISADELRDCLLEAIYPDFTWPPVPGDPSSAHLMWLVADHEARKTLANPSACPTLIPVDADPQMTPGTNEPPPASASFDPGGG